MEKFEKKIELVNLANKTTNEIFEKLANFFTPLKGLKICKKDHTLLQKYKDDLPQLDKGCYLEISSYHLMIAVRVSITPEDKYYPAYNHQSKVQLGRLLNLELVEICEFTRLREDYDLLEFLKNREIALVAKKIYEKAITACYPFEI